MKYVSLLPPEIKSKRISDRKEGLLARILIYVLVLALAILAFFFASNIMAKNDLESIIENREFVESQAEQLAEYEELYIRMTRAEEILNSAMGTAPLWSAVLQDIGESFFPFARLTDLTLNYTGGEGIVNMRGITGSYSEVATLIERIEKLDTLRDSRLRGSSEMVSDGRESVQFVLDAFLAPGLPYLHDGEGDD